jgi:heptosyltransferase-2
MFNAHVWYNALKSSETVFCFGPFSEVAKVIEVENLKCRPCSKIGFQNCPKGHFACMRQHDLDHISSQLNQTEI